MITSPTVVVAEDEYVTRVGVVHLLQRGGITVLAEAGDLASLLAAARKHRPDVVVTDVRMPPTRTTEGLDAAAQILAEQPRTGVLVLSQVADPEHLGDLLDGHRAVGYLLKERLLEADTLVRAIRKVAAGECQIDSQVVAAVFARRRRTEPLAGLTHRERDVLTLVAQGLSNAGIAKRLSLGERTAESHIGTIFGKLGLDPDGGQNRRVLAVLAYLRAAV